MSNYPDDIRMYDHDPRSPFYEEPPTCEVCGEILEFEECEDGLECTHVCEGESDEDTI